MIQIDNCQLEIDVDRGVLYVHSSAGITLVKVSGIPDHIIGQSYDKHAHWWKDMLRVTCSIELTGRR